MDDSSGVVFQSIVSHFSDRIVSLVLSLANPQMEAMEGV